MDFHTGLGLMLVVILGLAGLVVYFLPSYLAKKRNHPNFLGILIVNLVFGWSVIGWVAALVWAVHNSDTAPRPESRG